MLCLGIETSCDETAVALVQDGKILLEKIASQVEMHGVFGGVVPELASREHLRVLCPLVDQLFAEVSVGLTDLDGIAVGRGPGLLGSLLVGLGLAKGLALSLNVRLVGVDHLRAHLLAVGLEQEISFPALGLLVSGGHTQLYFLRSPMDMDLLGTTLDDAAGEAFDKVGKLLNLPYPGGAVIDRIASLAHPNTTMFPKPYVDNQNLDFSFSGLKTAVAKVVAGHQELRLPELRGLDEAVDFSRSHPATAELCASFSWSVAETLKIKVKRALQAYPQTRSLILAGGVAANSMIRRTMHIVSDESKVKLLLPSLGLCTDNAAMIAHLGGLILQAGFEHDLTLDAVPRGRLVPIDFINSRCGSSVRQSTTDIGRTEGERYGRDQ